LAIYFGRIIHADTRFPHVQLFCRLAPEFFKVGRLRGSSSDNHFALFDAPNLPAGPGPAPNVAAKLVCDEVIAARAARADRNDNRQSRRLVPSHSASVSDDEGGDDEATYERIQALFTETTNP
jgi:hypothetical protein